MPSMWRAIYPREMGRKNRGTDAEGRYVSSPGDYFSACNCLGLIKEPSLDWGQNLCLTNEDWISQSFRSPSCRENLRSQDSVLLDEQRQKNRMPAIWRTCAVFTGCGKQRIRNLPNKIVDALSLGLPILSPLQGEVASLIADYGVGMRYGTDTGKTLHDCIAALAQDTALQKRMSQNARSLYEKQFSFEMVYGGLVKHLEKMASRSRKGAKTQSKIEYGWEWNSQGNRGCSISDS